MSSMFEQFNRESSWFYHAEGGIRCSRCWRESGGLFAATGSSTVQCFDCSIRAIIASAEKQITEHRGFQQLYDLLSDEASITARIGAVIHFELLIQQLESYAPQQQQQLYRQALLQLGYETSHPLGKLLRLYAMIMVLKAESCFRDAVFQLAGEHCSSSRMRCSLAIAAVYIAPEDQKIQEYIESALAEHPQELQQKVVRIGGKLYPAIHKQYYLNQLKWQLNHWSETDQPLGSVNRRNVEYLLNALYGAESLKGIYSATLRDMHKAGEIPGGKEIPAGRPNLRKQQNLKLFGAVLSDPEAVGRWYRSLPVWIRHSLRQMLWEHRPVMLKELVNHPAVPQKIRSKSTRGFTAEDRVPAAAQFCIARNERYSPMYGNDVKLYLHPEIAKLLRRGIAPAEHSSFTSAKEAFSPELYEAENREVLTQLPYAAAFVRHNGVKRSKNGSKILKTSLKQAQEYASVPEPYQDDPELGYLRTGVLLTLLEQFVNYTEEYVGSPEAVLQRLFDFCFSIRRYEKTYLADFLEHLTIAWSEPVVYEYRQRTLVNALLSQLPDSGWVHVDDVYRFLSASELLPKIRDFSRVSDGVCCSCLHMNGYSPRMERTAITEETKRELLYLPYIRMLLFVLNTLGAVQLAVDYPEHPLYRKKHKLWLTPFDGIFEVSLTPLGARLAGRVEHDSRPETEAPLLHLDHRQLIVTVESKDPMAELMLQNLACRIGPSSYLVRSREFLSGCSSQEDVQERIRQFSSYIPGDLPENWEEFFARVLQQARPAESVETGYLLFRIDPEQTELINLLFKDEQIRKYIMKAEDYHVLIASAGYAQVRKRLMEYGYLLPEKQHINQG